jgi:hypothetical protein
MLIFGKMGPLHSEPALVTSRLIHAFEGAHCEVTRERDMLLIDIPSWDARLLPPHLRTSWLRCLSDRMILTVSEDGTVSYRLIYWSWIQSLLHLALTALFAAEFVLGSTDWTVARFLVIVGCANLLPALVYFLTVQQPQYGLLRKVRDELSSLSR